MAGEPRPAHIVFVINEDEYGADKTLPEFARLLEKEHGCRTTVLQGHGKHEIAGLEALADADLMVLFARRKGLPKDQMDRIRKYLDAGKPLVALRTACHAFAMKDPLPGVEQWATFDVDVLGCHYHGHGENQEGTDVQVVAAAAAHPVLRGIEPTKWHSAGSLYFLQPLDTKTTVLVEGSSAGQKEPVAWTYSYKGGRVFFTALGHREDFEQPQFRTLLINAVFWAMNRPAAK
jgi:type 1 glutamine amidotransferase